MQLVLGSMLAYPLEPIDFHGRGRDIARAGSSKPDTPKQEPLWPGSKHGAFTDYLIFILATSIIPLIFAKHGLEEDC